jgi:hypothetical protein
VGAAAGLQRLLGHGTLCTGAEEGQHNGCQLLVLQCSLCYLAVVHGLQCPSAASWLPAASLNSMACRACACAVHEGMGGVWLKSGCACRPLLNHGGQPPVRRVLMTCVLMLQAGMMTCVVMIRWS